MPETAAQKRFVCPEEHREQFWQWNNNRVTFEVLLHHSGGKAPDSLLTSTGRAWFTVTVTATATATATARQQQQQQKQKQQQQQEQQHPAAASAATATDSKTYKQPVWQAAGLAGLLFEYFLISATTKTS